MNHPRVVVILPTYNERENISDIIECIVALHVPNLSVMVVDDNSPDGTGDVVRTIAKRLPVTLISRERKTGLGDAYKTAFAEALEAYPDVIIQMDADGSHDPNDIPRFLKALESCDVVLGSRYIPGGGIRHWGVLRRMISRVGNGYARVLLHLPYRDLTGGYKCFRFVALRAIDFNGVSSLGYNFQIEVTALLHRMGFRIKEIPIMFTERTHGVSKFNVRIIVESFIKVLSSRFHV